MLFGWSLHRIQAQNLRATSNCWPKRPRLKTTWTSQSTTHKAVTIAIKLDGEEGTGVWASKL